MKRIYEFGDESSVKCGLNLPFFDKSIIYLTSGHFVNFEIFGWRVSEVCQVYYLSKQIVLIYGLIFSNLTPN